MQSPTQTHPNTTRVVGTGTAVTVLVWLLGHFGVALSAEDAGIAITAVAGIWVFIGRDGLSGAWHRLLHGTGSNGG